MNMNKEKLMKISKAFRILLLASTAVVVTYIIYAYAIYGDIRVGDNPLYQKLWQAPSVSNQVMLGFKVPSFLIFFFAIYWLQKLLAYFQQGLFFGTQSIDCYIWLVWLKLCGFFVDLLERLAIAFYHESLYGDTSLEISLHFGSIITILLMLVIVYLLKAATEIEAENKEFI